MTNPFLGMSQQIILPSAYLTNQVVLELQIPCHSPIPTNSEMMIFNLYGHQTCISKQPYHFWATQRCLTVLPATIFFSTNFSAHDINCNDIDLEKVCWSLGDCGWPSETPRRRAGAVDGELGDPNASLILHNNCQLSCNT